MTQAARVYGESMYALALEEGLTGEILEEMKVIRTLFQENPDYVHLLSEPSIPGNERIDLIEAAFGNQAERYLVNFLKLLCERNSAAAATNMPGATTVTTVSPRQRRLVRFP